LEIKMKKFLSVFAVAGLLGFAACAAEEDTTVIEEPVIEEPAPAPMVTEPLPMTVDSMGADSMMTDSVAAPAM
jgi:hypothetical protein